MSNTSTLKNARVSTPKTTFTRLGAATVMAFGVLTPVAVGMGAPTAVAEESASSEIVAVNQFSTELATKNDDCGPAGAVSAMLAQGITPDGWDANNPGTAVQKLREDIGHDGPTVGSDVAHAIASQGASATAQSDFTSAVDAAKNGKAVMLNGNMQNLPYQYSYPNPYVIHWVTVADYDAATDTFTVTDSNDGSVREGVTYDGLEGFQASLDDKSQSQVIVG